MLSRAKNGIFSCSTHRSTPTHDFHPEILTGSSQAGSSNKGEVEKTSHLLALNANISKTVRDRTAKVTINEQ